MSRFERVFGRQAFKRGAHARPRSGQTYVELALLVPLLLVMLAGLVEVGFVVFAYLNLLDLTREASRFASVRDFQVATSGDASLAECANNTLDYYKDTACFFIDPELNPYIPMTNTHYSDVVTTVFTVSSSGTISSTAIIRHPDSDGWSLYGDNWQKDCDGNTVLNEPFFTDDEILDKFISGAPNNRGYVLVEAYVCVDQMLHFPILSEVIPSPFRLHAYSMMPAPEAIPTPTDIPSP